MALQPKKIVWILYNVGGSAIRQIFLCGRMGGGYLKKLPLKKGKGNGKKTRGGWAKGSVRTALNDKTSNMQKFSEQLFEI